MNPRLHGLAARLVPPLALTGAWLLLAAAAPGDDAAMTGGPAPVATGPAPVLLAQAAPVKVSYTRDQADRGETRYKKDCEECHGDDLKGGMNGGPPLRGLAFEEKYANGVPASWMFEFMANAMPPNAPGRYSRDTYAELTAYILKRNGFQPGAPLPTDFDALDALIVER